MVSKKREASKISISYYVGEEIYSVIRFRKKDAVISVKVKTVASKVSMCCSIRGKLCIIMGILYEKRTFALLLVEIREVVY